MRNRELAWPRREQRFDEAELLRCLGAPLDAPLHTSLDAPPELLSGGLANANVRVGSRVVRLYRRDPGTAAKEAALLRRPWRTFRVPRVLREGEGFLVLEWVAHSPLREEHGAATGVALAEIHGQTELVEERFDDLVGALLDHVRPLLDAAAVAALERFAPRLRAAAAKTVLVHADFKLSNLHWTDDDRLLVLDWEFAYCGAALSDIGQLLRWAPPARFVDDFANAYRAHGGQLPDDWQRLAAAFDLFNLAGLLENQADVTSAQRLADVRGRIAETVAWLST